MLLTILREILLLSMAVAFQYFLLERRFSPRKTLTLLTAGVVVVFLANTILCLSASFLLYKKLYPLTVNVPVFLIFIWLSKRKGLRVLFNLLTAIFLCYVSAACGYLLSMPFHYNLAVSMFGQLSAFAMVLIFVLKVFRPLYFSMLAELKKGWALFCLIPLISYVNLYMLGLYPVPLDQSPFSFIPMLLTILLTIAVYAVICVFFRQMQQHYALLNERHLLSSQVTALRNQSEAVRETDEKLRILRHDMRHYTQNVAGLLASGKTTAAIECLGSLDNMLLQVTHPTYCENPTINAILVYHLENARLEGIEVKTRLDIPIRTPVDELELSAVLANAIENARNACRKMPDGSNKWIELVCVSKPSFVFEASNTYVGEVLFDKNGLPGSRENEHGIGTQSIAAFVKKHNAILDYQTGNGSFKLRILLNPSL